MKLVWRRVQPETLIRTNAKGVILQCECITCLCFYIVIFVQQPPFFILCDFHVAWFMVGLYLSHSGALDGARPPVRAGSAPEPRPEERIKRTSSSGPATDCEIQVNPGRYCNALHCRYVVMRSQSLLSESFPGHHCLPACLQAPLWGTGDRGGYVTASHDWHKGDMYCPLVILTVWRRLKVQISVLSLMKDLSFN